ncbi:hypothetical protein TNIN_120371 [Trichonephila inaurata madagascariensis]|uniref:Uncharacterized protein n=1 Tax=Trichonephila inaurata madagascariensis TaxID=2747483 RepID=A0A8X6YTR7_9ARAC|nr:hypothetical protein TNIN_120371 [Trichonephila inaurata madagascariensis]
MEMIDASENRNVEKIINSKKISEVYQTAIVAQMKRIYARLRKMIIDKFSLVSTDRQRIKTLMSTRAEKVEASEAVGSIAEEIKNFIAERVMGRLVVSANRNLEEITLLATSAADLATRLLLFGDIYEKLREKIIAYVLLNTKAYSRAEMINCSEVSRALTEEIGNLITSLQEKPISSSDFAREVMEQITTSENQDEMKIASIASSSQSNLKEPISSISPLSGIYNEFRQTVTEILSQKATQTGISGESEEVSRTAAEEIGSLIVNLQESDSPTSHGFQQRIME